MPTVDEDIAALRAATREAHEAVQALKQAKRDLESTFERLKDGIDSRISEEVKAGLERYYDALNPAIDKATAAVYKRFDTIADILLGEDAKARGLSLIEHAQRVAQVHRDRAQRALGEVDGLPADPPS